MADQGSPIHENHVGRDVALAEMARLDWARDLDPKAIAAFGEAAELVSFQASDIVIDRDQTLNHVYFIVSGRMKSEVFDQLGKQVRQSTACRGGIVGLFTVAAHEQSPMRVLATENTTAFRITLASILELSRHHPDFQLMLLKQGAQMVKHVMMVDRSLPKPGVIGMVHFSDATRELTRRLVQKLKGLGELPSVASDRQESPSDWDVPVRTMVRDGKVIDPREREAILLEWGKCGRLFLDFHLHHAAEETIEILCNFAEILLVCVRPNDANAAAKLLKEIERAHPWLKEKVHLVWLLDPDHDVAPYVPELLQCVHRDFKVSLHSPKTNQGCLLSKGIERIVQFLRGIQIGLALGGGAARGMAHLGVLHALEEAGIFVDRIAGTSAGAMTGTVYASGMSPTWCTECFKTDLQPSWLFRQLPGGGYWYLLYKYRFHKFEGMLRRYLHDYRMEQLVIPTSTIAVDLVEGEPLVRDTGDATRNILESINLPPLSLPIYDADQALVDGGLLNNVPANVLVSRGCNFVIACSVTAKLEKDFMGIRSGKRAVRKQWFSTLQVIMRQNMIQSYNMNYVGVEPADFVIAPDVTAFDISEFTRADEMAVVGRRTASESIGELKQLLSRLDAPLFRD